MKRESETRLDALLDEHERIRAEEQRARQQTEAEEKALGQAFDKLCDDVIDPTMREIGDALKRRHHDYTVSRRRESVDAHGAWEPAEIRMTVFPGGARDESHASRDYPHVSFMALRSKLSVGVYESTMAPGRGGAAGLRREHAPADLTTEVAEEEILGWLEEVLRA